jgi:chloramphenicol-sensitive protein RarD
MTPLPTSHHQSPPAVGGLFAFLAFFIWGMSPLYWKALGAIPAFEIIMHRVLWSFLFLLPVLFLQRQFPNFKRALITPSTRWILMATTLLVGGNWFVYIWAVNHDVILQTSLGYFISPLVSILLGLVFLKERLRSMQQIAVLLAAGAMVYLGIHYGQFPWIAIYLAVTFGLYGLIRKIAPVGALVGLAAETMFLSPVALGYLIYLHAIHQGAFLNVNRVIDLLLMGAALLTALPLLLFTSGARRIHLSTLGFIQYTTPTCTFLLAVFYYGEPFDTATLITFCLIWTALALYSADAFMHRNRIDQNRS